MVGRRDDREAHREWPDDGEQANGEVRPREDEHDPDDDVPTEVQAGERCVLVRQAGRLEGPVRARLVRDRIDQCCVDKPRRGDREEGEEEEPDRTGDEQRVAEDVVAIAAVDVESGGSSENHGPVTPDVDPVRERHEQVVTDDQTLDPLFPSDTQPVLESNDPRCVGRRLIRASNRSVPNREVRDDRERDEKRFTRKSVVGTLREASPCPSDPAGGAAPGRALHVDCRTWHQPPLFGLPIVPCTDDRSIGKDHSCAAGSDDVVTGSGYASAAAVEEELFTARSALRAVRVESGRLRGRQSVAHEVPVQRHPVAWTRSDHTFGAHLVRQGADVVTVSRQMGHARPSITVDLYSHEFAVVEHRHSVAWKLTDAFSGILAGLNWKKEHSPLLLRRQGFRAAYAV